MPAKLVRYGWQFSYSNQLQFCCVHRTCLLKAVVISLAVAAFLSLGIYHDELHLTTEHARRYCSPLGTLCVTPSKSWQSNRARSKCRRTVSLEVIFQDKLIHFLAFTFGERGHRSTTLSCQEWVQKGEGVNMTRNITSSWHQIGGPNSHYYAKYNRLELQFNVSRSSVYILELRIFDSMLGVRTHKSGRSSGKTFFKTTIRFPDGAQGTAYLDNGDEKGYFVAKLNDYNSFKWRTAAQAVPIAFVLTQPRAVSAFSEACNAEIPNLRLRPRRLKEGVFRPSDGFVALFEEFERTSPFVVFHFADTPESLASQQGLAGLLCDSKFSSAELADQGWVVPGTVIREMGLSTDTAIEYMQVCSALNVRYLLTDAGWYGPEESPHSDPLAPVPVSGKTIDISRISNFGKRLSPPVYTVYYLNDRVLHNHTRVEKIARTFSRLGVRGVKVGFVRANSVSGMGRLVTNIKIFEAHRIMVNIHDSFRDYYLSRRFPSVLSVEGVRGSEHDTDETLNHLILPLTRLLAGRMDYTFTSSNASLKQHGNISMLYQICLPFVLQNGLQHIFWYESARNILKQTKLNPYFNIWKLLPYSYNRSTVLEYVVGESICMSRQLLGSSDWFIVGVTVVPRKFVLNLTFLAKDSLYKTTLYRESGISEASAVGSSVLIEEVNAKSGFFIALKRIPRETEEYLSTPPHITPGLEPPMKFTRLVTPNTATAITLFSNALTLRNALGCVIALPAGCIFLRKMGCRARRVPPAMWSKGKVV